MQSIIRKIKSMPILAPKPAPTPEPVPMPVHLSPRLLTHSELQEQIDRLEELIDLMIKQAKA
jgi:hypothetical protein